MKTLDSARALIRPVPDFPRKGILFQDLTPLLGNAQALESVIAALSDYATDVDCIAGVEARGFIFGAALAHHLSVGFVPIRKSGKLPSSTYAQGYGLEYGADVLEIHQDAFTPGSRVLLIDDVLATGGTLLAAQLLIHKAGGALVSIATVIEISALGGRARLISDNPALIYNTIFTL